MLLPLSWIYGLIVRLRNFCFDLELLKEQEFSIPIISVGNITVGGTGKTPHIEYLIRLLRSEFKIAVLSRGYKRKTKGFILADEHSDSGLIGDEPLQIKSKFPEIVVAVDANRRNGIKQLLDSDNNIDLILLDDAFQHRYVKPGFSILLIDFNRPIINDFLLPAGQLREPASSRKRADIILITKSPSDLKAIDRRIIVKDLNLKNLQYLYFTSVIKDKPVPVFKDNPIKNYSDLIFFDPSILLIAGIANPSELRKFAEEISINITEKYFPDHHVFTIKDISDIVSAFNNLPGKEKILITTEKDASRFQNFPDLPEDLKNSMFYIPISVVFLNEDAENFNKQIISYVRDNKRNRFLHSGKN